MAGPRITGKRLRMARPRRTARIALDQKDPLTAPSPARGPGLQVARVRAPAPDRAPDRVVALVVPEDPVVAAAARISSLPLYKASPNGRGRFFLSSWSGSKTLLSPFRSDKS